MSRKKPGIKIERHEEIGELLKKMRDDITQLSVEFANAYPRSGRKGRPYRSLRLTEKHLDNVRCWAEENYAAEYPENWSLDAYYGYRNE